MKINTTSFNDKYHLILLSFLTFFVELVLIRWAGANVIYLSYFSNFILLGSFLGIGIGFLRANAKPDLFHWAPVPLALLVIFIQLFHVEIARSNEQLLFFGFYRTTGLPIWFTLPMIFIIVSIVMAMIAQGLAQVFNKFEPLTAYRLDILGSLLGIVLFSLLSFLHTPPAVWGIIIGCVFLYCLLEKGERKNYDIIIIIAIMMMVSGFIFESATEGNLWSPYYKISLYEKLNHHTQAIYVNGIPHQDVESTIERRHSEPFYFLPYQHRSDKNPPQKVLIVGAGTGSDTAIALLAGAKYIDAVEIDPVLAKLGLQLNPDRPFQNPRVHVTINDGRAFLEHNRQKYDLILFALPDSLTLVAGQSSLRLESFLFTREAIMAVRNHLTSNGVFALYNYYRAPWLIDRLANTLRYAYQQNPLIDTFGDTNRGLAVLTVSTNPETIHGTKQWSPTNAITAQPATDDHPFVYLKNHSIPTFYIVTLLLILLTTLLAIGMVGNGFHDIKNYLDLFFMGTAFLLLETKSLVNFALLFGTTWFVNALVFVGILLSIYLANELIARYRFTNRRWLYSLLLAALAIAWLIPTDSLLSLILPLRFIIAILLAFMPVFLANLIFSDSFRDVQNPATAFGINLLGAMIGGMLEYAALIIGYRSLLIVVALLYTAAFIARAGKRNVGLIT